MQKAHKPHKQLAASHAPDRRGDTVVSERAPAANDNAEAAKAGTSVIKDDVDKAKPGAISNVAVAAVARPGLRKPRTEV
jgi:hypothetical protein